jgi:protein-disulfide isomerase
MQRALIARQAVLGARLCFLLWALAIPAHAQAPASAAAAPGAFTPSQRAAIVEIIRSALKTDPSILREALVTLQAEEGARQEAASRGAIAAATDALTHAPGDPTGGNPTGRVTLVEFYDVRCPYCRRMLPVEAQLLQQNADVKVIYKDIPILGPGSVIGARALLAAQKQGGYDRLRRALMTGPADITTDTAMSAAGAVGLDTARLARDMADPAITARIDANLALAHRLDIQGTPAYVVGGQMLPGAVELSELQDAVAAARAPKPE